MPCRYDPTQEELEEEAREARKVYQDRDMLTRWLCNILGSMELYGNVDFDDVLSETKEWWEEHKEADRIRKEKEAAEALAKDKEYQLYLKLKEKFKDVGTPQQVDRPSN